MLSSAEAESPHAGGEQPQLQLQLQVRRVRVVAQAGQQPVAEAAGVDEHVARQAFASLFRDGQPHLLMCVSGAATATQHRPHGSPGGSEVPSPSPLQLWPNVVAVGQDGVAVALGVEHAVADGHRKSEQPTPSPSAPPSSTARGAPGLEAAPVGFEWPWQTCPMVSAAAGQPCDGCAPGEAGAARCLLLELRSPSAGELTGRRQGRRRRRRRMGLRSCCGARPLQTPGSGGNSDGGAGTGTVGDGFGQLLASCVSPALCPPPVPPSSSPHGHIGVGSSSPAESVWGVGWLALSSVQPIRWGAHRSPMGLEVEVASRFIYTCTPWRQRLPGGAEAALQSR